MYFAETTIKTSTISHFNTHADTTPDRTQTHGDIVEIIQSNKLRHQVEAIRNEDDPGLKKAMKGNLPAVTFAGVFSKRNKENCTNYNGLVVLDFDNLDDVEFTKEQATELQFTHLAFISPSGTGLKVVGQTGNTVQADHAPVWQQVADYYANQLGVEVDQSGKDICRLCYLSHDPQAHFNETSLT